MNVDLFAGGGGFSTGFAAAIGRSPDLAINHNATAIAVHEANHPTTKHLRCDVYEVDPVEATQGRSVSMLIASPDCTHFSKAKGSAPNRPRSKKIRALAWVVVRWAQAVRPRVILVENVEEFTTWGPLDLVGDVIADRKGETFRAWVAKLRRLGYLVDWKVLDASMFGAPTRRKRLFVVARCDGAPISWPAQSHGKGPGLAPFRTAGECIDWSIPSRSIFGRKKPLAEKTLHRIAEGIRRFVLETATPYIVQVNHGRDGWRGQSIDEPLTTVSATQRGHAVVAPHIVRMSHGDGKPGAAPRWGHGAHDPDAPLPTVTGSSGGGGFGVAMPYLVNTRNGERAGQRPRVKSLDDPAPTVTAEGSQGALAAPIFVRTDMHKSNAACVYPPEDPLRTVTSSGGHAVALASFVAKHFGGVVGHKPDRPLDTVTARDHNSVVAANLVVLRNNCDGASLDEPMPAITAQGLHLAECRAFLTKWYSSPDEKGASLFDPAPTATGKARFGLVVVDGVEYEIGDIYLRMLEPEELLRAQFGEYANGYDLSLARTKEAKTKLVGNSVCPHVAAALVRSNLPRAVEAVA